MRAANGSTMRICGALRTTLDFGTFRVTMKLTLLEDLFYDVVLGINFFDEYVASIRPADLKMQMRDGSIVSFRRSGIKKASISTLVCKETVTVMPYSKSTCHAVLYKRRRTRNILASATLRLSLSVMVS